MKEYIEREGIVNLVKEIKENFNPIHHTAIDAFIYSHQAQTTCWDHPKMTELYQTLGKNSRFLYRVEIYKVTFVL